MPLPPDVIRIDRPNNLPEDAVPINQSSVKSYKPTFDFVEPTSVGTALARTGQEALASFAGMGNIILANLPQTVLRRYYGQELPTPPSTPGKILKGGLETLGFVAGAPGKLGTMASAPIKALGKGLLPKVAGGAVEVGTAMGIMQGQTPKKQAKEAGIGALIGAAFPLGIAAVEKVTPTLAKIFTGTIPPSHTRIAMENPELVLNEKALANEEKVAGQIYNKYVNPLIRKETIIDRQPFIDSLISQDIITPDLQISPVFETQTLSKLTKSKQQLVIDWIERICGKRTTLSSTPIVGPGGEVVSPKEWAYILQKGKVAPEEIQKVITGSSTSIKGDFTFKDAMKLRNEIGPYLENMWKKLSKTDQYSSQIEKTTTEQVGNRLRGILAQGINAVDSKAGMAIERWYNYEIAKNASQSFKGIKMSFFKTILPRVLLASLGMPGKIASLASLPFSVPKAWGGLIRGGAALGRIPATAYVGAAKAINESQ
jgi:hypothetical protein